MGVDARKTRALSIKGKKEDTEKHLFGPVTQVK
jgi:hypothetical protein